MWKVQIFPTCIRLVYILQFLFFIFYFLNLTYRRMLHVDWLTHGCRYWHWKAENRLNLSISIKKLRVLAVIEVKTAQISSWISQGRQLLTALYLIIIQQAGPSFPHHLSGLQVLHNSTKTTLQGPIFYTRRWII
jgi:hypothetical protein